MTDEHLEVGDDLVEDDRDVSDDRGELGGGQVAGTEALCNQKENVSEEIATRE